MALTTAVAAGAVLGVRHALETDHLAAMATLVGGSEDRPSLVGASWGVGHSIPIVVLGLLFVALGIRLPAVVTSAFEVVVGVVLVLLGGRMLASVARGRSHDGHDHGGDAHAHLRLGTASLGFTHTHLDGDSFLVGVVHGFAGSGLLVVALVSAAPTMTTALVFLLAFSVLTVLTMGMVSYVWGRTLGTRFAASLHASAGLFGVVAGGVLIVGQIGSLGVL